MSDSTSADTAFESAEAWFSIQHEPIWAEYLVDWMSCPCPTFTRWNLRVLKETAARGGVLGRWLSHEGSTLTNRKLRGPSTAGGLSEKDSLCPHQTLNLLTSRTTAINFTWPAQSRVFWSLFNLLYLNYMLCPFFPGLLHFLTLAQFVAHWYSPHSAANVRHERVWG